MKNLHVNISLEHNPSTGEVYEAMDCALRTLAYHRGGVTGLEVRKNELKGFWLYDGVQLDQIPQFEQTFTTNVNIYSLEGDGGVIPRYLSKSSYADTLTMNLHDQHLSYVTNKETYLKKWYCQGCHHFDRRSSWSRHQGSCSNATKFKYPGGQQSITSTIFKRLDHAGISDSGCSTYSWLEFLTANQFF